MSDPITTDLINTHFDDLNLISFDDYSPEDMDKTEIDNNTTNLVDDNKHQSPADVSSADELSDPFAVSNKVSMIDTNNPSVHHIDSNGTGVKFDVDTSLQNSRKID